ncbi:MAG TPA: HIT family protein [Ktedonobacterales bacterium]|nr:HIT family protein [Ktedonobacterales bacterium]
MGASDDGTAACFVCHKHRGEIVIPGGAIYEDVLLYAGHIAIPDGQRTVYCGWLIVEPKRHAPGLADLTDEEAQALGLLVTRLSRALKAVVGAEHIYSFVLGNNVPHLHIHLVPRYPGTPREYWGVNIDEWPDAPQSDAQALADLCDQIRAFLAQQEV